MKYGEYSYTELGGHTVWNDSSFNNRTKEFGALGKPQGLEPTANGVDEAESGGLKGKI